jgi:DnaB-like helicase C terminal domain
MTTYFEKKDKAKGKHKLEVVELSINVEMLDSLVQYSMSDNQLINKKALLNLRKLVDALDMTEYKDDFARNLRVELIKKVLQGQLDNNIYKAVMLQDFCLKELSQYANDLKPLFDSGYFDEPLSNDEVMFVNDFVEQNLQYSYLHKHAGDLESALQQLKLSDAYNLKRMNSLFEGLVDKLYKDIKSAKSISQYAAMDFSINGNNADTVVRSTIEELRKPNNHMKMGLKQLNNMLDGGLENGRVYLIFGLPKGFKSGTLLNLAIWVCKYNKKVDTKDKTKKPCVLYVTQENSIRETLQRIFVYSTGKSIKDYDEKEALRIIRDEIIGDSPIDLFIKYRPNKTISTHDLNDMCDDLELEGYEVVTLVQDYTKRIRSANYNPDIRLELGNVVDDFTVIAKTRNIPLVSAGQLNREAYRILENALQRGRTNIGKDLNASHVGESALMIENTDYGIIINKEEDLTTKEEFLTFKLIASRAKKPTVTYFAHPFENGLRLQEDLLLSKSVSIDRIGDNLKDFDPNKVRQNNAPIFGNPEGGEQPQQQAPSFLNLASQSNINPSEGSGIDF